ncbi:uncharacterized protein LOC120172828 [Hibiscus syriacus]|uniref:uncharacterized protein LOC120172828 n=1 Tax=Hibiscus syriacus TaxID=106335 RepID=UPI00192292D6|nr:uncharacterized protein LOC120172828 [Hibiscus syriacus]
MTNAERKRHHIASDRKRPLCAEPMQDINHLLRLCLSAVVIWSAVVKRDRLQEFLQMEMKAWITMNLREVCWSDRKLGYPFWRNHMEHLAPAQQPVATSTKWVAQGDSDGARQKESGLASCGSVVRDHEGVS